jgi:hypothetical protein
MPPAGRARVRLRISGLLKRLNASLRLLGFSPIARALVPSDLTLEPRPLCSTVVTRFPALMGLSDFPTRPARVLTDRRLHRPLPTHEEGSPVLTRWSFARMPSPLPRCPKAVPLSLTSRLGFGLLLFATRSTVTLPLFRGLLSVHYSLGPARSLIPSKGPFPPEALTIPVTQDSHSGCFRLERQLPGGIPSSHWTNVPFSRRTAKRRLVRREIGKE